MPALYLTFSGNIGLLIYAMDKRTVVLGPKPKNLSKKIHKLSRIPRAVNITVVWTVPIFYATLAMIPQWNCVSTCKCTTYYLKSGEESCNSTSYDFCSRIYSPLSNSYLFIDVIIWFLICMCLLVLFYRAFENVRKTNTRNHLKLFWQNYKVLIILFILYFFLTFPFIIILIIDFANLDSQAIRYLSNADSTVPYIITPLPLVYTMISPVILVLYLPGLKSAMVMLTLKCFRQKTTDLTISTAQKRMSCTSIDVGYRKGDVTKA